MRDHDLPDLARKARAFLEPLWIDFLCDPWLSVEVPLSTGACRVSSEFLAAVLPGHGFHGWEVHGGPDAFTRWDGTTADHYWLSNGSVIIDVTADQFGLPPVVLGPPDPARYRQGPATPLSPGARSEAGCIEAWAESWRARGGVPRPSPMSVAALDAYAGPMAGTLALLLHRELGLPLYLVRKADGVPHPLVWDGQSAFDARGRTEFGFCEHAFGCSPGAFEPTDAPTVQALFGRVAPGAVEDAYAFAMAHPALREAVRQAFYERRDAQLERDGPPPGDEDPSGALTCPEDDGMAWDAGTPSPVP